MRAGDARGAIRIAGGGDLLGFWGEKFFDFSAEGVAPRASRRRNKIAGCWRAGWVGGTRPVPEKLQGPSSKANRRSSGLDPLREGARQDDAGDEQHRAAEGGFLAAAEGDDDAARDADQPRAHHAEGRGDRAPRLGFAAAGRRAVTLVIERGLLIVSPFVLPHDITRKRTL